jgi:hypothetical protein
VNAAAPDDSARTERSEKPARRATKKAAASTPAEESGATITTRQMRELHGALRDHGITGDKAVHDYLSLALGRPVESRTELSPVEAAQVIAELEAAPILHGSVEAALIAFQAEMPVVGKNQTATVPMKQGGSYSYTYADLADVTAAATPLLTRHGLAFSCCPRATERGYELVGVLLHVSGTRIEGALPLHGNTAQDIGSSLTYMRRYLLGCMTGIVTDNDDDGQLSQGAQRSREWDGPTTAQLLRQIEADALRAGVTYEFATAKFREARGIDLPGLDRLNPWEVQPLAEIVKARADEVTAAAAAPPAQSPTPAETAAHNGAAGQYHGPTTPELLAMIDDHASRAGTTYAEITAKWRADHGNLTVAQLDEQDPRELALLEASISAYLAEHPPTPVG